MKPLIQFKEKIETNIDINDWRKNALKNEISDMNTIKSEINIKQEELIRHLGKWLINLKTQINRWQNQIMDAIKEIANIAEIDKRISEHLDKQDTLIKENHKNRELIKQDLELPKKYI